MHYRPQPLAKQLAVFMLIGVLAAGCDTIHILSVKDGKEAKDQYKRESVESVNLEKTTVSEGLVQLEESETLEQKTELEYSESATELGQWTLDKKHLKAVFGKPGKELKKAVKNKDIKNLLELLELPIDSSERTTKKTRFNIGKKKEPFPEVLRAFFANIQYEVKCAKEPKPNPSAIAANHNNKGKIYLKDIYINDDIKTQEQYGIHLLEATESILACHDKLSKIKGPCSYDEFKRILEDYEKKQRLFWPIKEELKEGADNQKGIMQTAWKAYREAVANAWKEIRKDKIREDKPMPCPIIRVGSKNWISV